MPEPLPDADAALLALDVGGTKLAAGLVTPHGELLASRREPTRLQAGPEGVLRQLVALGRDLLAGHAGPVSRVGVGCGGPLDRERGIIQNPPNLPGWHDVPLKDWLEDALDLPVDVDNDANAAALAEWRFGSGRGCEHLVYLTLSTGIGGGVILNGQLYTGRAGNAGELGHLQVEYLGEPCTCGGRGCLERYASGTGIGRRAREWARRHPDSLLAQLDGGPEHITAHTVRRALEDGDPLTAAFWDDTLDYLAAGVAGIIHAFDPQRVVIGGGVANFGDLLFPPLRAKVAARTYPALWQGMSLRRAELADHVGIYGAAAVALSRAAPAPHRFPVPETTL
ncbi:glucokinase [Deinococcus metalli]|uniref:Glucokinase n=1 Tax=Deinococcus metalli TaxID=1141878 RepID=A0A7W8KHF1_9DEIO|nr:ROK family protein [Deinococcus metalli]MBB5377970.1 glucokinase [Deinococcus metalli]GHF53444.1 glucokinase [Deinococcus metalli]